MRQFFRFCVVGTVGFCVDVGVLQTLVVFVGLNPYAARLVSFFSAASVTWLLNRRFTFSARQKPSPAEWLVYMGLMLGGAAVNYGVYCLTISSWGLALNQPWIGVALGSLAAMALNFATSSRLFRSQS